MRTALYRKLRPQKFSELVDQEYIKTALRNQIRAGSFSHAYLFAGPKGTGKTTTARILAAAINCLDLQDGEPCGKCAMCVSHDAGNMVDLIEIDAASNRKVEDIRELVSKVNLSPGMGKYKVYILDEAHMLTADASNTLLKTLEEPPAHAVFVLATTQPESLLPTILSRCLRFDFKPLSTAEVAGYLEEVAKEEGIDIRPDAVQLIAELSHGGMRDALSLLDQAAFMDGTITKDILASALGFASLEEVLRLTELVTVGNSAEGLKLVNDLYLHGHDMGKFAVQWMSMLRSVLLAEIGGESVLDMTPEQKSRVTELVPKISREVLLTIIDDLITAHAQMRTAAVAILPLEVMIVKTAHRFSPATPSVQPTVKIEEHRQSQEVPTEAPETVPTVVEASVVSEMVVVASDTNMDNGTPSPDLLKELVQHIKKKSPTLAGTLTRAKLELADGTVILRFGQMFHKEAVERNGNIPHIKEFLESQLGSVDLVCVFDEDLHAESKEVGLADVTEVFGQI